MWTIQVAVCACVVVLVSCATLVARMYERDVRNCIFLSVFGSMQFMDAYMWYVANQEGSTCTMESSLSKMLEYSILMLEPISALLGHCVSQNKTPVKTIIVYAITFILVPILSKKMSPASCKPDCGVEAGDCWPSFIFFGPLSREVPMALRTLYLVGVVYPYTLIRPMLASILYVTLLLSFYSPPDKEMRAWATIALSLFMVMDPYVFKLKPGHPDQFNAKAYDAKTGKHKPRYSNINTTRKFFPKKVKSSYDVIVIGSGIGGLTTASLIANTGKSVLVLEQHDRAGGCLHTFTEHGGYFDSGVHYVGNMMYFTKILACVSHPVIPITWASMGNIYDRIVLDKDDVKDPVTFTVKDFVENLCKRFPDDAEGIRGYIKFCRERSSDLSYGLFFRNLLGKESMLYTLLDSVFGWENHLDTLGTRSAYDVASDFSLSEKAKMVLTGGQMIDHNETPRECSWWVTAAMLNYYAHGGFYPVGGSQKMTETMVAKIRTAGHPDNDVVTQARVSRILLGEEGQAVGVLTETGTEIRAGVVISDAGIRNTYGFLLPLEDKSLPTFPHLDEARAIRKLVMDFPLNRPQMNGFIILNKSPEHLGLQASNIHSLPGCGDFKYDIDSTLKHTLSNPTDAKALDETLMCLTCPCVKDTGYTTRFPGESNIAILALADEKWFYDPKDPTYVDSGNHAHRTDAYKAFKKAWAEAFVRRIKLHYPKIQDEDIRSVEVGTPVTAEHFLGAPKGATYGMNWRTERLSPKFRDIFKPLTPIPNLYVTGEGAFVGGIVPASLGGVLCTRHVLGFPKFIVAILNNWW
uniref:Amine oxidase domain-containing protein n=1 Tax=Lotharella globosa TaxID=91324 RepID=A0A7S3YMN9_9EUKA